VLGELLDELATVRQANIALFDHMDQDAWLRTGTVNQNPISTRGLAYILVGQVVIEVVTVLLVLWLPGLAWMGFGVMRDAAPRGGDETHIPLINASSVQLGSRVASPREHQGPG
jgi:hypothetical protein